MEFSGGDRLPGKVTAYRTGTESPLDRQPPHLVVDHLEALDWPTTKRESLRVTAHWLRRIVWQPRASDRYQPAMLFLRDGRQLRFRSLRFQAAGARVLLEEKTAGRAVQPRWPSCTCRESILGTPTTNS